MRLTPEQERVLKEILGSVALRLEVDLNIPIGTATEFINGVERSIAAFRIFDQPYALSLTTDRLGKAAISKQVVRRSLQAGNPILVVDTAGRYVESLNGHATHTECCRRTHHNKNLEILVSGSSIFHVLNGSVIGEVNTTNPGSPQISGPTWSRRFSELDDLLRDHMKARVAREQGFRYWSDRESRILLTGPKGTEWIFHYDLLWWIRNFAADALDVYAEPSGFGQNKTDINVVTSEGAHVIEIKWLGKNEKGTEYRQDRINEGLVQIKLYLDGDENLIEGHLVVYDGRPLDDHTSKSDYENIFKHTLCTEPKILFLESETPSVTASAAVKAVSVKKK